MPRRPRQRSGSINISRENTTTTMVRRRVLNTYSRVCPRQLVNRHHFLTPNTPITEELELPSHLLRDSTGDIDGTTFRDEMSSQIISSVPSSANRTSQRHGERADVDRVDRNQAISPAKKPKLDISTEEKGVVVENQAEESGTSRRTAAKKQRGRKQPARGRTRKRKTSRKPKGAATPAHARSAELEATETRTDIVDTLAERQQLQQDDTTRDVTATGAGQSARDHTHSSCNLEPVSMEMTCEATVAGRANSLQPSLITPCHAPTSRTSATQGSLMPDSTSNKLKLFLETVAAGLGHSRDGRNISGLHSFHEQPGSADSSLNVTTPNSKGTSHKVSGNSESKERTLKSDSKNPVLEGDSGNCAPRTISSLKSDTKNQGPGTNSNSTCTPESNSESCIPRNSLTPEPGSNSNCCSTLGSKHALESDSEDDIEVPRKRDPYDFEESTEGVAFSAHNDPPSLEFSPQDPTLSTEEGGPTILECMGESTPIPALRKRRARTGVSRTGVRRPLRVELASLCSGVELEAPVKGSRHRNSSLAGKDSSLKLSKKRTLKRRPALLDSNGATPATKSPAQKGRGSTERSGWGSSANSNLKEHFSGLQMTPITCPAPIPEATPTARTLAPLTSTPMGVNGRTAPGSSPRSIHGFVSFEHTPDLNATTTTTLFLNRRKSSYPLTSTPIDPHLAASLNPARDEHQPGRASNMRDTPSNSWVGSTMDRLLDFDEIGFEASERLAVSHAGSVEQHSTQSTAAAGQSKSGPQLAARSSLCKQPQPRQRGKKGHSSKTGSKPPNSAKSRSQPSKESTSKQGESSAKQRHQEHGKDTAAARKRGRPCTNTDTKSKRAKSVEKRAPRRDPTPKSSAGQGGLKPAATAKKRKKRRWIIPPALKKLYNINKGAGTAAITATAPRNKSPPNSTTPGNTDDHPICILVRLSKAAGTTRCQHIASPSRESIHKDILRS